MKIPELLKNLFKRKIGSKPKNRAVWVLLIGVAILLPISFLLPEVYLLVEILLRELLDLVRQAQSAAGI